MSIWLSFLHKLCDYSFNVLVSNELIIRACSLNKHGIFREKINMVFHISRRDESNKPNVVEVQEMYYINKIL